MKNIKITFGIIVLNGEPFTKYCLRSIYPYAHEIIVVEGATKNAKSISTDNGHSRDNTLNSLKEFKEKEDTENKLKIITKSGFWNEKDEMSQTYAKNATGNYLWQVDIDEFYHEDDMEKIINILKNESPDAITFKQITFHSNPNIRCNSTVLLNGAENYNRLFKWGPGYKYKTHRPPTVTNKQKKNTKDLYHIKPNNKILDNIFLYHYSLLFPSQVTDKIKYYEKTGLPGTSKLLEWANSNYFKITNPFNLHNIKNSPGWVEKWEGKTPKQISSLFADIKKGEIVHKLRDISDLKILLNNQMYIQAIRAIKESNLTRNDTINLKKVIKSRIKEKIKRHGEKIKNITNRKSR